MVVLSLPQSFFALLRSCCARHSCLKLLHLLNATAIIINRSQFSFEWRPLSLPLRIAFAMDICHNSCDSLSYYIFLCIFMSLFGFFFPARNKMSEKIRRKLTFKLKRNVKRRTQSNTITITIAYVCARLWHWPIKSFENRSLYFELNFDRLSPNFDAIKFWQSWWQIGNMKLHVRTNSYWCSIVFSCD